MAGETRITGELNPKWMGPEQERAGIGSRPGDDRIQKELVLRDTRFQEEAAQKGMNVETLYSELEKPKEESSLSPEERQRLFGVAQMAKREGYQAAREGLGSAETAAQQATEQGLAEAREQIDKAA